ncbi:MinD/ParA family ATP-binding protein [Agromyces seonyuensis]|uniref:AAA family ATPase n=1 Tax=Agromyces seonyuensis TaxID=2662446 RepID=A0A6I4NV53_9MICO|nr:AAA family ATPase [Agromyces seonyuensis]MWB98180.1 AAA family ATPase [Agromyces seonyuensis]
MTTDHALDGPTVTVQMRNDGSAEVRIDDEMHIVLADSAEQTLDAVSALIAIEAAKVGRPLPVMTYDPTGTWPIIVHPDGKVVADTSVEVADRPRPVDLTPMTPPAPAAEGAPQPAPAVQPVAAQPLQHSVATMRSRRSFIEEEQQSQRATRGWRGAMNKVGMRVAPSAAEAEELEDLARVSRHWAGPRTIAIVNGKGGAGKTPSTAMLSAIFARNGGAGVLAWDNNETRGTLGWRTEQGAHDATIHELLPNAAHLIGPMARVSDLTAFVHHQTEDRYDVLRSNPNVLAENQRLTSAEFDAVHAVAAKYFRLIVIDSGNDESAERWRRMVDQADQLVIATTAQGEHAEAGALLLEALRSRDGRAARLADQAVVIVSQSDRRAGLGPAEHIASGFRPIARKAVVIPYDPAMRDGKLRFDRLAKPTRRAWLAAAGAVADGL